MKMVALRPCDDLKDKAPSRSNYADERVSEFKIDHGNLLAGGAGAAEAITQAANARTVKLIGLGLPSENKKYVLGA